MDDHHDLPDGLSPEAKKERERFLLAFRKQLEKISEIALSILVWGPNLDTKSAVAEKRRGIYEELKRLGHNAMSSEELTDIGHNAMYDEKLKALDIFSERAKEFAQVRAADLAIILIEDSPGALTETADFSSNSDIASKLFVLAPHRYRGGYAAIGVLTELEHAYGGVFWYGPQDLEECNVATAAVKRAEALRYIRYRGRMR